MTKKNNYIKINLDKGDLLKAVNLEMVYNRRSSGQKFGGDYFFEFLLLSSIKAITSITNIIVIDIDSYVVIAPSPFI